MSIVGLPAISDRYYVYAMLCQDGAGPGYVKFGRSKSIGKRLSSLRTGCPIPARFFAIVEVGTRRRSMDVERALHRQFGDRLVTGEWYRFDFTSREDKQDFNSGCRAVFDCLLRRAPQKWWTKFSVAELDRIEKARKAMLLAPGSKLRQRKERIVKQRRAWRELERYGQR